MIAGCGQQLRAGAGRPYGLDFNATLAMGEAQRADLDLLSAVLPQVEDVILKHLDKEDGDDKA